MPVRRALLSVTDKSGIEPFGRALVALGYELVSTGGTLAALERASLPVVPVSQVTGFPEMMDGRVKTLHPAIFGGILARRSNPGDLAELEARGLGLFDVVVVNLYAFERAAGDPKLTEADVLEQIDIGGPSLVRASAKNWPHVFIVTRPEDYGRVADALASPGDAAALRRELAGAAFGHTARYDAAIAAWFHGQEGLAVAGRRTGELRYGENPHQRGALYRTGPGYADAAVHQGKALSYNNWLDLSSAYDLCMELGGDAPAVVIVKHGNPCGAARGGDLVSAWQRALATDPVSAFGGVVAVSATLDAPIARQLTELFLEVVIAPEVTPEALEILSAKKNLRVLTLPRATWAASEGELQLRSVRGAVLGQGWDLGRVALADCRVVTRRHPTAAELADLQFAWDTAKHVKSNAIVFARESATLAVGAGQMSRIDSVALCRLKARSPLAGAAAASDAFFPFRDGLDAIAEAGATAIVQPGGSVRDEEVIAAADERGIAMVFTGTRHFRH